MQRVDLVVVGAGAAGLMAAGTAAGRGLSVYLIDKNEVPGRKLRITGKGRCNVTNNCDVPTFLEHVPQNPRFLYSALNRFTPVDSIAFFESLGVPLKTERGRRVFPQSDRADDIANALADWARQNGAVLLRGSVQRLLTRAGHADGCVLSDGRKIEAAQVLLACGGASYPATGSNGAGYRLAEEAGHTIVPLRPSLVPLACAGEDAADCARMAGLDLRNIGFSVYDTVRRRAVYEDFGELSFTRHSLAGPVVLSASACLRDMAPGRFRADIDLKPALSPEKLDARLLRDWTAAPQRPFAQALEKLLPRNLIPVAVRRSGIAPQTPCSDITRAQRRAFGEELKRFSFRIEGFRPIEEAIVTAGGVSVREIDPRSMQSKKVPGLYIAGELLDVDAYTGGYNLHIAFATGRLAGESVQPQA